MKIKIFLNLFFICCIGWIAYSCGSDDDICLSGEATPRMKIKFKTKSTGNLRTLDTLYIDVDYGKNDTVTVIANEFATDSVLIPLRVDENPYTDIFVKTGKNGTTSHVRIGYTTTDEYVSAACGIKRLYEGVSATIITPNPVVETQMNQIQILDESKTHLFLLF